MLPDTGDKKVTREAIVIVHILRRSERMLKGADASLVTMIMREPSF